MLIPVIQDLQSEHGYELIVMGLTTASENLQEAGLSHIGYRHLVTEGDEQALKIGEKMAHELGASSKICLEETVAYLGLSYQDLIDRLGEQEAENQLKLHGRQAFLPLSIMERAFKKYQPDLVVATNAPRSEKAAILTARKMGIPSVCLVDMFDPREFEDRIGQPGYADRVCVLGDFVKETLVKEGRKEEEIISTGNPNFDNLEDPGWLDQAEVMVHQQDWTGKRIILWARQVNPRHWEFYRTVEEKLNKLVAKHPDWQVIIRPHPNDPTQFGEFPDAVHLSKKAENIVTLLHLAHVVITVNSTVGMQGVILGKPLITMDMISTAQYLPYSKMGLALGIQDLGELEEAIEKCLSQEFVVPELKKVGQAAQNVVGVIKCLLGD